MGDPLKEKIFLDKFHGVTELVRTVDVSLNDDEYRIEVYKHHTNEQTPYTACCFVKREVRLANPEPGLEERYAYLLDGSFPWVSAKSGDAALGEALSFLEERNPKRQSKVALS